MTGINGREMTRAQRYEAHNRHEAFAEEVGRMFAEGLSYRSISEATGIPKSTVVHMTRRLSADYARERYGDLTAALGRELEVLDMLTRRNLKRAMNGDKAAADIVMNAHTRRSKLLGLDAAVKAELTVKTTQDIEIERLVKLMSDGVPDTVEGEVIS